MGYGSTTTAPFMPASSWIVQMYGKVPAAVNLTANSVVCTSGVTPKP